MRSYACNVRLCASQRCSDKRTKQRSTPKRRAENNGILVRSKFQVVQRRIFKLYKGGWSLIVDEEEVPPRLYKLMEMGYRQVHASMLSSGSEESEDDGEDLQGAEAYGPA